MLISGEIMTTDSMLFSEQRTIPSANPAVTLHLRHKRLASQTRFDAAHTVVLMHGATYSSGSLFDTPVDGESFLDYLARAGFDVWAVDVSGSGGSTRPPAMQQPAALNPPLVTTEQGVRDFSDAVTYVLQHNQLTQVNIIGMSWGGSVTGSFTTRNADKVRRLGLIAPQWLNNGPSRLDSGGELGAWRLVTLAQVQQRWLAGVPQHKRDDIIPDGVFDAWVANTLSEEPDEALRASGTIRVANGPVQDIRDYWRADRPFYQPADISVPLLLVHGEWDVDVPLSVAQDWFLHATGAPWKRWLEIGEATHMMVLEKNRRQVFAALAGFLLETHD
ncbi:alpha/beta hydrolase [Serratia odorifera]|jgi:pimeloyl-ACP methyl ester carboxylesterase|nr:alpha/beta hydrolase [Serratia odorifera]